MSKHISLSPRSLPVRKSGVVIIPKEDEYLLRNFEHEAPVRLNKTAMLIWESCNGVNRFEDVCRVVEEQLPEADRLPVHETSRIVSTLITKGYVQLNHEEPYPLIRIGFINPPAELDPEDNCFLRLFSEWFDLLLTPSDENAQLIVAWQSDLTSQEIENAVVRCLVDLDSSDAPGFDVYFRHEGTSSQGQAISIALPRDYLNSPDAMCTRSEREMLGQLFGPDIVKKNQSATNRSTRPILTIGMATYDDYDGVYFSIQAIRLFHPEVTELTELLVIDNHPGGPCSAALKQLEDRVEGYRYVENNHVNGTAVRDFVFHEAMSDYVMCIDSHVFIVPGAIRKLIDYFLAHPDTSDLLQGPLIYDDLESLATHFEPVWRKGMFGVWDCDERGVDPDGDPFEIPMQGLGLAACRKDAWLGYNSRFSGFGGEEGYIHQKFRNEGAQTLCLPFLRWMHRFDRPMGPAYQNIWEDRIRNYLIGFDEVGLDDNPVIEHFSDLLNSDVVQNVVRHLELEENNPFDYFDAIYCINLDSEVSRWEDSRKRFEEIGIRYRVKRFSAVETPGSHHAGCALSHRAVIAEAKRNGYRNVLVFEDDVVFRDDTLEILSHALSEIQVQNWQICYLGGMDWTRKHTFLPGCRFLELPGNMTCTHAIVYHNTFYDQLLNDIPEDLDGIDNWLAENTAIDQYLIGVEKRVSLSPVIASQLHILPFEGIDQVHFTVSAGSQWPILERERYRLPGWLSASSRADNELIQRRRDLPESMRDNAIINTAFFAGNIDETFSCEIDAECLALDSGDWVYTNPSLLATQDGYVVNLKRHNVILEGGIYLRRDNQRRLALDNPAHVENYQLDVNSHLKALNEPVELSMSDCNQYSPYPAFVTGFEDGRLIEVKGKRYLLAANQDSRADAVIRMSLLEIEQGKCVNTIFLFGHEDHLHQKNWMPFTSDGRLLLVSLCDPLTILEPDLDSGFCTLISQSIPSVYCGNLRGNAQGIRVSDGTLFVVHEVSQRNDKRVYLHRFLLLDDEHNFRSLSHAFYMQKPGIEFVAGMTLDVTQKNIVLSWGQDDSSAWLGQMPLENVMNAMVAS